MPKKSTAAKIAVSTSGIESRIHTIRKHRVILDNGLAELYQVETAHLNRAIKRNAARFPKDFMFQLSGKEWDNLICQIGISSLHGGRRFAPYAFTEQGVAMLASVLNSPRAVQVNIQIVRTFMKLREIVKTHKELAGQVEALERKYEHHDEELKIVFSAIKQLLNPPDSPRKRRIGFPTDEDSIVASPSLRTKSRPKMLTAKAVRE